MPLTFGGFPEGLRCQGAVCFGLVDADEFAAQFFPGLAPAGADRIGPECCHFFLGAAEGKGQFCGCDARDIPGCGAELQPAGGILFLLLLDPGGRCSRGRPAWSLMVRLFPGLPFFGGLVCGSVLGDGRACGGREGQGEKNSKNDPYPEKNGSGGFPNP